MYTCTSTVVASETGETDGDSPYSPLAAATSIGTAIAGFLRPKGHITLRRIEEAKRAPNALFAKKKSGTAHLSSVEQPPAG